VDFCPFYYSFTCYQGGTLGFTIVPDSLDKDDYDWMLFDITNRNPQDIYKFLLVVMGNWSGTLGPTGARAGGSPVFLCASEAALNHPTFSEMPVLIKGHQYLLLVSNYSENQSGYTLSFAGGTALLNDPTPPILKSAFVGCDKQMVTITLDKKIRCNSVAPDGSDFMLASGPISVISASGLNCGSQFDNDSIQIFLNAPLAPGNYSVILKTGNDGNTLLDDCGDEVVEGANENFSVVTNLNTPMDSLTKPSCAPDTLHLVFSTPMQCNSIAVDGSDFSISGTAAVGVSKAIGVCEGGLTNKIDVILNTALVNGGNYTITLNNGSDGNTLNNICGVPTPAGSMLSFTLKDTVNASFGYTIGYGCVYDTIHTEYVLSHGVNQSGWFVDAIPVSSQTAPSIPENIFNNKHLEHFVSNGFCNDSASAIVPLDNEIIASFQSQKEVCPKDLISFSENSTGKIIAWYWDFSDGSYSNDRIPPDHLFPNTWAGKTYNVKLIVKNNIGCFDTASLSILKKQSCAIGVPNAFTPNGDGKNDFLYPLNTNTVTNLEFKVFNRYGQLVFETRDKTAKWDGTMHGVAQHFGTYVWTFQYTDGLTGEKIFLRGTSVLIR